MLKPDSAQDETTISVKLAFLANILSIDGRHSAARVYRSINSPRLQHVLLAERRTSKQSAYPSIYSRPSQYSQVTIEFEGASASGTLRHRSKSTERWLQVSLSINNLCNYLTTPFVRGIHERVSLIQAWPIIVLNILLILLKIHKAHQAPPALLASTPRDAGRDCLLHVV